MEEVQIIPVKLTKKALNEFIGWTSSRYNDYMGYGTKREAVDKAYYSIKNGYYTSVIFQRNGRRDERKDESKILFTIQCASPVGESGSQNRSSFWRTKQVGGSYTIDCKERTITANYSKRVLKFI